MWHRPWGRKEAIAERRQSRTPSSIAQGVANRTDLSLVEVGPIIDTCFDAVLVAADAGQPIAVGRLVRIVPRPDEPDRGRVSLLAVPGVTLQDATAGTLDIGEMAGGWRPTRAVAAAELVKVVASDRWVSQRLVRRVLDAYESEVSETLLGGTKVRFRRGVGLLTPWADRPVKAATAALVSVVLGPRLKPVADELEKRRPPGASDGVTAQR